jgi:hypothetical protein
VEPDDLLITRRNDIVELSLYQPICVLLSPHDTRISSSMPRISHHEQRVGRLPALSHIGWRRVADLLADHKAPRFLRRW